MEQKSVIVTASPGMKNNKELNDLLHDGWKVKTISPLNPCHPGQANISWAAALVIVEKEPSK